MKRIILCVLCFLLIFSACTPVKENTEPYVSEDETESLEPFSGVWLTYSELSVKGKNHTEESYREYIRKLFSSFREKGINNVFVHAVAFCDALYDSELYETSEHASGKRGEKADFDILSICATEGRKQNLKIHAWINPYRVASFLREDYLTEGTVKKWYEEEKNIVCEVSGGLYLNPASQKVQKLVADAVREILTKYDVDGIHFDDYFYPPACGNFDKADYKAYVKKGGKLSLFDFRRENVNNLLSLCYSAVKSFGEEKIFSVSPSGDTAKNYSELFSDVSLWCKGGFCDMIIPQLYYGFENETKPFEKVLTEWLKLCENSDVKLLVGLALYKVGEEDNFAGEGKNEWIEDSTVIERQKELSLRMGADGIVYFSSSYIKNLNF